MNENQEQILKILKSELERMPDLRFAQLLFNLGINEFADKENPEQSNFLFRDNHGDSDEDVLSRIKERIEFVNSQ